MKYAIHMALTVFEHVRLQMIIELYYPKAVIFYEQSNNKATVIIGSGIISI